MTIEKRKLTSEIEKSEFLKILFRILQEKKNFFFLKIKLRMGNDCIQPFAQFSNTAFSTSFSRIFIGWVTALSLGKQLDQTIGTT